MWNTEIYTALNHKISVHFQGHYVKDISVLLAALTLGLQDLLGFAEDIVSLGELAADRLLHLLLPPVGGAQSLDRGGQGGAGGLQLRQRRVPLKPHPLQLANQVTGADGNGGFLEAVSGGFGGRVVVDGCGGGGGRWGGRPGGRPPAPAC